MKESDSSKLKNDPLSALRSLAQNVDQAFEQFQKANERHMRCKAQCSACCQTDISIFPSEAARILNWIDGLSPPQAEDLHARLLEIREQDRIEDSRMAPDATGASKPACSFLYQGLCLIYPVRPIICRSQGAILTWIEELDDGSLMRSHDVCPLNFSSDESMPEPRTWLDLDRLTALQSLCEQNFQSSRSANLVQSNQESTARVSLRDLRNTVLDPDR